MIVAYEGKGISREQLADRAGKPLDDLTEADVDRLKAEFKALVAGARPATEPPKPQARTIIIKTNAEPPADAVAALQGSGYTRRANGEWAAPESTETQSMADLAQAELWCDSFRIE